MEREKSNTISYDNELEVHSDSMTRSLLNNLIGGVAFMSTGNLEVLRVNEGYYQATGCNAEALKTNGRHISTAYLMR